jgi:hypothetical protein
MFPFLYIYILHDDYVKNILTPEETKTTHTDSSRDQIYTTTKKFWSYIKGMKKDSSNISIKSGPVALLGLMFLVAL